MRSFDFFAVQVSKIPLCLHRHHHPNVRLAVLQNIGQKVTISNFALWDLRSSEALYVYLHAQLCPLDDWLKLISIFFSLCPKLHFPIAKLLCLRRRILRCGVSLCHIKCCKVWQLDLNVGCSRGNHDRRFKAENFTWWRKKQPFQIGWTTPKTHLGP